MEKEWYEYTKDHVKPSILLETLQPGLIALVCVVCDEAFILQNWISKGVEKKWAQLFLRLIGLFWLLLGFKSFWPV